jgi:hypothetical protein
MRDITYISPIISWYNEASTWFFRLPLIRFTCRAPQDQREPEVLQSRLPRDGSIVTYRTVYPSPLHTMNLPRGDGTTVIKSRVRNTGARLIAA